MEAIVRCRGATQESVGALDVPVTVGGQQICPGDLVVLDADRPDGVTVVTAAQAQQVLAASFAREEKERLKREHLREGAISYDLDGLRAKVEDGG